MVSPEAPPPPTSGPRISFSAEFLDDANFICINPHDKHKENKDKDMEKTRNGEFEFLSCTNLATPTTMLTPDELFFEGKLLPFWQKQRSEQQQLTKVNLKTHEKVNENNAKGQEVNKLQENNSSSSSSNRMSWFIDEDPSPRPPKCTVLWKELLRLKKQRASSLSPSSSSNSNSSSSNSSIDGEDSTTTKKVKRIKKGLERTRSTGIKIRPMVNLPICTTQTPRTNSLPPLFSLRKGGGILDRHVGSS